MCTNNLLINLAATTHVSIGRYLLHLKFGSSSISTSMFFFKVSINEMIFLWEWWGRLELIQNGLNSNFLQTPTTKFFNRTKLNRRIKPARYSPRIKSINARCHLNVISRQIVKGITLHNTSIQHTDVLNLLRQFFYSFNFKATSLSILGSCL